MSRVHEDNMRTATERLRAAHRRVDPELARLVVRSGDDTAPVRVAADDKRLRAQLGILELLHSGEEGVEVQMGDDHARSLKRTQVSTHLSSRRIGTVAPRSSIPTTSTSEPPIDTSVCTL